jgi:prophage maintenance system killer protein
VGKKTIHHMDFDVLVNVNKTVVDLTGEPHSFTEADRSKLAELVQEVEQRADNQEFEEAVPEKASLLMFKIASGQYFRAGNKRTALVAGLAFLAKNGYSVDITNPELVSTVDRVGVAAAGLDDLNALIRDLKKKAKTERRGWDGVVEALVEANRAFLTDLAA